MLSSIRQYLLSLPSVTDITSQRMYLFHLPQPKAGSTLPVLYPAVTLHIISRTHGHHLDGADGYCKTRVQIDTWSENYSQCSLMSDSIRLAIDGFRGAMSGVTFGAILCADEGDGGNETHFYEQPVSGSNFGLYHIASDYFCWHFEATSSGAVIGGPSLGGSSVVSVS